MGMGWVPSARRGQAPKGKNCDSPPSLPCILPYSPALGDRLPPSQTSVCPAAPAPWGSARPRASPPTHRLPFLEEQSLRAGPAEDTMRGTLGNKMG